MKATNQVGTLFAIKTLENGNALVMKLCSNYDGNVRGGISKKWRCVQPTVRMSGTDFNKMVREGLPMSEAKALFDKRIAGRAK